MDLVKLVLFSICNQINFYLVCVYHSYAEDGGAFYYQTSDSVVCPIFQFVTFYDCESKKNRIIYIEGNYENPNTIKVSNVNFSQCKVNEEDQIGMFLFCKQKTDFKFCSFQDNSGYPGCLYIEMTDNADKVLTGNMDTCNFVNNKITGKSIIHFKKQKYTITHIIAKDNTQDSNGVNIFGLEDSSKSIINIRDCIFQSTNPSGSITTEKCTMTSDMSQYNTNDLVFYNTFLCNADNPFLTPEQTPYETPFTTPFTTPLTTPEETPYKTPFTTPLTTPFTTPLTTPEETPYKTPFRTTTEETSSETNSETGTETNSETDIEPSIPSSSSNKDEGVQDGDGNGDEGSSDNSLIFIIIGVVCGILVIIAIIIIVIILRRRKQKEQDTASIQTESDSLSDVLTIEHQVEPTTINLFTSSIEPDSDPFQNDFEENIFLD